MKMKRIGLLLVPVLAALTMVLVVSGNSQLGPTDANNMMFNFSNCPREPLPHGNKWNVTQERFLFLGAALAYPFFDVSNMTQEEKDLRVQILELKKDMIDKEISYLNGEITKDEFDEELKKHFEETKPLQEQMMEQFQPINMTSGCGGMKGFRGRGHRMMGWGI
jgi:hypothetical protein